MEILVYSLIVVAIVGIIAGGIWLSKKYNVDAKDYEFVLMLLGLINYVTMQIEWKYKEGIANVMEIVIEAVTIVKETEEISNPILIKDYALEEAKKICEERGIEVDAEFVSMLNVALDYLLN